MGQMVTVGNEILRISPKNACHIEYSYNGGRSWLARYIGAAAGKFMDLQVVGGEVLAQCQKGTFYSKDKGHTWLKRS